MNDPGTVSLAISLADINAAAERIAAHVIRTPSIYCESLSKQLGCKLYFKAENLQYIGAFKARGAMNAVLSLDEESAAKGVVTHSSGNHAAALARAASIREIPAHVVMPHNSAPNKIERVQSFGVNPVFSEPDAASREETCKRVQSETGATFTHPYDNPFVMAGQGTVGLEILQQVEKPDVIIAPVGGGGLLSGVLTAVKESEPNVEVIAAEPEWADDADRSLKSGQIEQPTRYDTVADGLRTPLGELTFPIIKHHLNDLLLVGEASIRSAVRTLASEAHLIAEPSGAVTLAAILNSPERFRNKTVVAIVSGGNLDLDAFDLAPEA
ncbi:MAG: serine dehydratase [Verrucomicrobiales bacterium]|mgnify:CR=1 FL=1|nr:serine dehydratase [Verrucomicrobiales bacterium]|tara:strand:+ start:2478 stop:3455 length:978 start_codon:yes stop_codon:yes gene_type:complete